MRRSRIVALGSVVLALAGAWACSSFDATPTPEGPEGGALEASSESSMPTADAEAGVPDADAGALPCISDDTKIVFHSTFDAGAGPSLLGWTLIPTIGDASINAVTTDAGEVAESTIRAVANPQVSYAVIHHPLSRQFAVRFSFSAKSLVDDYIVHQALDQANTTDIALSLHPNGWAIGTAAKSIIVGPRGDAGAWHTVTYTFAAGTDAGGIAEATMDTNGAATLDLSAGTGIYTVLQMGAYWPRNLVPPPSIVVDYDDVTVWDCSK